MSNYYVRRTGDDSNYLAHANGFKYLTKINIGGKVRYIYNQAQLAAARAGRTVADATGLTARRAYQSAKKARTDAASSRSGRQNVNLQRAAGRAKKAYNKTLLGRIENTANAARKAVGKAAGDARRAGQSFAGTVTREAYRTGYRMKNKAIRLASQAKTNATRYKNKAKLAINEATGAAARKRMKVAEQREKALRTKARNTPEWEYSRTKNSETWSNAGIDKIRRLNEKANTAGHAAYINRRKYERSLAGRADSAKQKLADATGLTTRNRKRRNKLHASRRKQGSRRNYVQ